MLPLDVFSSSRTPTYPVFNCTDRVKTHIQYQLLRDGAPLSLHEAANTGTTGAQLPLSWTATLAFTDAFTAAGEDSTPVTIINADLGQVEFDLAMGATGVSEAVIAITDPTSIDCYVHPCYVSITVNPRVADRTDFLTVKDVREALIDTDPGLNVLLDALEFQDDQIARAILRTVDVWNTTPPAVGQTVAMAFPYKEEHLRGTCGILFTNLANLLQRNHLPVQGAGVSVDDNARYAEYQKQGQEMLDRFQSWVRAKKYEINVARAFGSFTSEYYR